VRPLALALIALAALVLALPAVAAAQRPPDVSGAAAAIVIDGRNGEVMYAKRPDERRSIASTTKLMTALLALERARPRQVFTAPEYNALPAESRINLRRGERMTVQDLLEALLLESANDAAAAIAENLSGSREAFVAEMNVRAEELGLENTSYANPIGLDDPANYSTARDLATLTRLLLERPRFARIVDMPVAELESGAISRVIDNRNTLVASTPWVTGVKTGHTMNAGYVLVGSAKGRGGAEVISVVLGEPSEPARDADTLELLTWGLGQFRRVQVLDPKRALARARIRYYEDDEARLVPRRGAVVTIRRGERVRRRVRAREELEGPLAAGARAGVVTVLVEGERVRRIALVTAAEVPEAGTLRVLTSVLGVPLTLLLGIAILLAAPIAVLLVRGRRRSVR
jgi:serine-type D-Ala-D-Ala carboxypeptidase (penicillin-binding protein 5/6)